MIKIIEAIKDYAMGKYFDFITEREMNQKDPNYFGKVSDEIANSKSLKLIFTVRNKKYTYVIK